MMILAYTAKAEACTDVYLGVVQARLYLCHAMDAFTSMHTTDQIPDAKANKWALNFN